jgi:outer membrane protein assembly factor BamE (lipoprotein component of BamABCDE complex)
MCSLNIKPQALRPSSVRVSAPNALRNDFRAKKPISTWMLALFINCTLPWLSSCWIPPVWDHYDAINQADTIKPGVTTREEVIQKFGQPAAKDPCNNSIQYTYTGNRSEGFVYLPIAPPGFGLLQEKRWRVVICFDEKDVVTSVSTSETGAHGTPRKIHNTEARPSEWKQLKGDPKWLSSKEASTYCPNADLGHPDAQRHIGDILYHGAYGRSADPVRAWVWYSLAAQNGDEAAKAAVTQLTAELPSDQLEDAKRQLAAWKPSQCMQELTNDDNGQEVK